MLVLFFIRYGMLFFLLTDGSSKFFALSEQGVERTMARTTTILSSPSSLVHPVWVCCSFI